jgi:hypothetical protein
MSHVRTPPRSLALLGVVALVACAVALSLVRTDPAAGRPPEHGAGPVPPAVDRPDHGPPSEVAHRPRHPAPWGVGLKPTASALSPVNLGVPLAGPLRAGHTRPGAGRAGSARTPLHVLFCTWLT